MEIDFKTIFIVILIIGVIGGAVYLGMQIMFDGATSSTPEISETTQDTSTGSSTSQATSIERKNTTNDNVTKNTVSNKTAEILNFDRNVTSSDTNFIDEDKLSKIYGTGLNINNNNPKNDFPDNNYSELSFSVIGNCRASFYVPNIWERNAGVITDPITEATLECKSSKMSEFMEVKYNETTYEDVLKAFIQKEERNAIHPDDLEFSTRELKVGDDTFTVIVKKDGDIRMSYIVFIKGLYEYHLEFRTKDDKYDQLLETIDNIFSSYKVY